MRAAFISTAMPRCAAGSARPSDRSACRRRVDIHRGNHDRELSITIRRARRDDVAIIVGMLADDPLGSARERIERRCRNPTSQAFEKIEREANLQLVVAEDSEGIVVGCLQLCILPGLSSQGASRG